jgi:hypothetical protein
LNEALNMRTRALSETMPLLYGSSISTASVTEPALGTARIVYLLPRPASKVTLPTGSAGVVAVLMSQRKVSVPIST